MAVKKRKRLIKVGDSYGSKEVDSDVVLFVALSVKGRDVIELVFDLDQIVVELDSTDRVWEIQQTYDWLEFKT